MAIYMEPLQTRNVGRADLREAVSLLKCCSGAWFVNQSGRRVRPRSLHIHQERNQPFPSLTHVIFPSVW